MDNPNKTKLLCPELSYQITGILFKVHNALGNRYHEKYYQRAVALELTKRNIPFKQELTVPLTYQGESIGRYVLDFLIDNRLAGELKAIPRLLPKDFAQVRAYLKAKKLELGLLTNFRATRLNIHRILYPKQSD